MVLDTPVKVNHFLDSLSKTDDINTFFLFSNQLQNTHEKLDLVRNFNISRLLFETLNTIQLLLQETIRKFDSFSILNCDKEAYSPILFGLYQTLSQYENKNRCYHNTFHVIYCLNLLNNLQGHILKHYSLKDFLMIKFALLFHDVVYTQQIEKYSKATTDDATDEEKSAKVCSDVIFKLLKLYDSEGEQINRCEFDLDVVVLILELIKSTDHKELYFVSDEKYINRLKGLICDIDLSILATKKENFDNYRLAVRKEYSYVSDETWKIGSKSFAKHFLENRQQIFSDPYLCSIFEETARNNLKSILEENDD